MSEERIQIDFAIKLYNALNPKETPKMSMMKLATEVFPDLSPTAAYGKISALNSGSVRNQGTIRISHIKKICEVLQVQPNLLFSPPKQE
jgi:hypothetical protein